MLMCVSRIYIYSKKAAWCREQDEHIPYTTSGCHSQCNAVGMQKLKLSQSLNLVYTYIYIYQYIHIYFS